MFTVLAFFLWLVILPFAMGPSVAFHAINEEKRYESPKISTSLTEKVLNGICGGILIGLFYVYACFPSLNLPYPKIFGANVLILAVFYLVKIIISLNTGKPISVLIGFSLISRTQKVLMLLLFGLLILVALENLHIISTYLR